MDNGCHFFRLFPLLRFDEDSGDISETKCVTGECEEKREGGKEKEVAEMKGRAELKGRWMNKKLVSLTWVACAGCSPPVAAAVLGDWLHWLLWPTSTAIC